MLDPLLISLKHGYIPGKNRDLKVVKKNILDNKPAARCCWPNWATGMCWAGSARQPRSVCNLRHLLFQLGNALVLVGDGVFDGFQLFQNLIQFGFVLSV